ncbi:MAG: adenylate/guanylate cyclase domain-containing protein [FCB group bacterium]|jgi:class 3 adenylate cyclase/HAMP domain-containing protein|nr:adenylate/guanylate cyclase domain-containing protein [FCB group bacterium]
MLHVNEGDIDRITEALHHVLNGQLPEPIALPADYPDNEVKQLVQYVNNFLAQYGSFAASMQSLSSGDLDFDIQRGRMHVLQSLKNLHANLRHLTWKTLQIAKGDFSQRVDFMGEFSTAFNSMAQQLKDAFETIEQQNRDLAEANRVIQEERDKSDRLLLNILPARIADELKQTGKTKPELFDDVTVLFSDLVGFTRQSATLSPTALIGELNDIFTHFDAIAEANACERIKTIGDAYLAVCGMPIPNPNHARNLVQAASQMVAWLQERNSVSSLQWFVRVGINSGPVVGSVVGTKKYIYDVFGDTVNTASRMESHSEPMRINVSEATRLLARDYFTFLERPPVEIKGKGSMKMYLVS